MWRDMRKPVSTMKFKEINENRQEIESDRGK